MESVNYSIYDLNLLITADGNPDVISRIDNFSASVDAVGDALALLKALFVGQSQSFMLSSTTKLIPLRDYVLSRFNLQFRDAVIEEISQLVEDGTFLKALSENSLIFNENSIEWFDIVLPSLLTVEERKKSGVEFYILPIKMITPDLTGKTLFSIASLFEQESEIQNIVAAIKSTELYQSLLLQSGSSLSLTPLIGDKAISSLRGIVAQIRRIQGNKNGRNY